MPRIIYYSSALNALNLETAYHQELQDRMNEMIENDSEWGTFENRLAMIAAYCNLEVDGWLRPGDELDKFADLLTACLQKRRSILIM